jgi:predicted ATPase
LTRHLSEGRKITGQDSLSTDRETVVLASEVWCDVDQFQQLIECPSSSPDCLASLTEAVNLYRDDFLTGFTLPDCPDYDEWQFFQTEGLRQQLALTLERLIKLHIAQANYEIAIPYARRWLVLDPLHEPAHQQLMQLYAWRGQWAAAIRQYETCLRLLEEELGIPPTKDTEQLYQVIKAKLLNPPVLQAEPKEMAESQKPPPVSMEESDEAILNWPSVVARESELARLNGFLEQAIAGQGRVVFVVGEAGAGKTTLVSEFIRQAQRNDPELLSVMGNCNAQRGRGDPYLPFRELLGLLTGDVEDKLTQGAISVENARRLRKFFNVSGAVLVEHGPVLINTLLSGAKLAGRIERFAGKKSSWLEKAKKLTANGAAVQPDLSQAYIFEQYTAVLQALAAKQPLVLWLDDLHWVDPASADLLFHLGRRLEQSHILVLGTYRPEEIAFGRGTEPHLLANVVSEFKRSWGNIHVDLDQARLNEGRHFVEALLDTEPNRFDETFRQTVYNHTGGHPLFTIELLRDLQERAELVQDNEGQWLVRPSLDWGGVPARVEGVIEKRIGRLDIELQEALTIASVEGEQFTVEVVAHVQGVTSSGLVRRLSGEVDKQHRLVQARASQRLGAQRLSRYQFRHSLIRSYLYHRLDEVERAYLHEAVGQKLEELCGGQIEMVEAHLETLAYHFYEAGIWSKTLTYAQQAGEKALALQAPQDAVEQFTQALDAAAQLSQQPPTTLYRLRGQAFDILGYFDQARADYEAAQEAADAAGDQRLMWQTLLDLGQLWASRDYEKSGDYCQKALKLARSMKDQDAIGHSLNRLGNWLMNTGQPFAALDCHREALERFETLDDPPGIAATLDLLAATSFFCGNLAEAVAYYERATDILRDLDNRQTLVSTLANLALSTLNEDPAREAINVAQEIEWRSGEAYALHNLGLILITRGNYGQGLSVLKSGCELARDIDHRMWQAAFNNDLGVIYMALLAFDEARRHLESGLEIAKDIGANIMITYASGCLASLYIRQQQFDEAAKLLPDLPVKPIMGQDYWLVKPAAELVLTRQGALSALQLLDRQDLPDQSNWLGWPAYFYGAILLVRGQMLVELGRFDEAETVLHSLLNLYQTRGIRMDLWRIHLARGKVYQAVGNLVGAETAFASARTIIEELASTVTDDTMRENFRRQAFDLIPRSD